VANVHAELYLHLVWATCGRRPMITEQIQQQVYVAIAAQCKKTKCELLAVGGIADHVHVLARIPPTISVAELARRLKGASSYAASHENRTAQPFRWQGSYGAFTVSRSVVPRVRVYVLEQKRHHADGVLSRVLEATEAAPTQPRSPL